MLFLSKTKISRFNLLSGTTISTAAKYLGVEIDIKLNWKINIGKRIKKCIWPTTLAKEYLAGTDALNQIKLCGRIRPLLDQF